MFHRASGLKSSNFNCRINSVNHYIHNGHKFRPSGYRNIRHPHDGYFGRGVDRLVMRGHTWIDVVFRDLPNVVVCIYRCIHEIHGVGDDLKLCIQDPRMKEEVEIL